MSEHQAELLEKYRHYAVEHSKAKYKLRMSMSHSHHTVSRMADYYLRLQRKFPERDIQQVVIYLKPTDLIDGQNSWNDQNW